MFLSSMFQENYDDVGSIYDSHLLSGHFTELDDIPYDLVAKTAEDADKIYKESIGRKNGERISAQAETLVKYLTALSLLSKCSITDIEGLLCFVCIRHPELELDWTVLQKLAMHPPLTDYQQQKTLEVAAALYISAVKNRVNILSEQRQ